MSIISQTIFDMAIRVLIVDDSMFLRMTLKDQLIELGYDVVGMAANGEEGVDMAFELLPDLITLDNIMPDMIGTDVLATYREEGLESKVVMISAVGQQDVIEKAMDLGANGYITKPFTPEKLQETLGSLFD